MKVLLDTNVIVDVLQHREPWNRTGERLFDGAARHSFTGCITAKEVTDIHYLTRKIFCGQPHSDALARDVLKSLFSLFEVLDTCADDCKNAVLSDCPDYEDAVMIQTALRSGIDCIVTRNTKDFAPSLIPVFSPGAFLEKLDRMEESGSSTQENRTVPPAETDNH